MKGADNGSLKILRAIERRKELTMAEALALPPRRFNDHRDMVQLAALIEDGYIGCTMPLGKPPGGENMGEFFGALSLHMNTMPAGADGWVEYLGIRASQIDTTKQRVFLRAKGSLFLDTLREKRAERLFTVGVAALSAALSAIATKLFS